MIGKVDTLATCKCGRAISRHMKGECMACRYKWIRNTPMGIKINPRKLPVPRLQPTRPMRIENRDIYNTLYERETNEVLQRI